jgi:hypothetical protein
MLTTAEKILLGLDHNTFLSAADKIAYARALIELENAKCGMRVEVYQS